MCHTQHIMPSSFDAELAAFDAELQELGAGIGAPAPAAASAAAVPPPPPQARVITAAPKVTSSAPFISAAPTSSTAAAAAPVTAPPTTSLSSFSGSGHGGYTAAAASDAASMRLPAPPQPPPEPTTFASKVMPFMSANRFMGFRQGYVFKNGQSGLGYYQDLGPRHVGWNHAGGGDAGAGGASMYGGGGGQQQQQQEQQRNITRTIAGEVWDDKTLLAWPEDDFRLFVGDLGNEANDEALAKAFERYPSFQMCRVVRDKHTHKVKGYGFVSFKDPWDMTKALREMQGKYVGNRPIKVRKSTAQERQVSESNQPLQFSAALGVSGKAGRRHLEKAGAIQKKQHWHDKKKKQSHLPW